MEFSRQEYWSGLRCPPPGDPPDPGIEPRSPALQADSLLSEPPGRLVAIPIMGIGYPNFAYLWVQNTVQLRCNVTKKSFCLQILPLNSVYA